MELAAARKLALQLFEEHHLTEKHWGFGFDTARTRFGVCKYGPRVIQLSRYLTCLNDETHVKDVIMHEIAHALCGPGYGHGPVWKQRALTIGCDGQRCYGSSVAVPTQKYKMVCPSCGYTIPRNRRWSRPRACTLCCRKYNSGRYDSKFNFVTYEN